MGRLASEISDNRTGADSQVPVGEPAAAETGAGDAGTRLPAGGGEGLTLRLARFALPAVLVGFVILFSVIETETFATTSNLRTILLTQSVLAVLAIAAMLPLVIGEFDLSVGANLGLAAILVTGLPSKQGLGLVPAIIVTLAVASGIGVFNGLLVAKVRINAFIATLGVGTVISGVVLWYTNGTTIFENLPPGLTDFAHGKVIGIPTPVIGLAVITLIVYYLLENTPFGRYLHAIGGSREAARLSGLNVDAYTIITFTLTGLLCGIAGIMESAQLGAGNPNVGPSFLLPAFAAAFLGATTIKLGSFNVLGTIIAVFTIATGITGLELMGVPAYVEAVFSGTALILAVTITRYLHREAI